jgi:hypothetical protein
VPNLRTLADTAKRDGEGHGGDLVFFLAFAVFLAAAVGSTTHRALFLEQPVKLPIFGVDLPLVGFCWVAPALFLILHFYMSVQLETLAGKMMSSFHAAERVLADPVLPARLLVRSWPAGAFGAQGGEHRRVPAPQRSVHQGFQAARPDPRVVRHQAPPARCYG